MEVCPPHKFEHIFWEDQQLRELVQEVFPQCLTMYDNYQQHIQRVDFARAAMLYRYGGLYVDMDMEARSCPFEYFAEGLVSIVASPYVQNEKHQNSLMASPPRHPFWLVLVQEAQRRFSLPEKYKTTWQLTGPQLLDSVIDTAREDVHVLPAHLFNPAMQSAEFSSSKIITRHFCTSVWTHDMDTQSMRLYQATRSGDLEEVHSAVEAKADVHCRDYAGLTPLHHASIRGHMQMVEMLVALHADVSAKDRNATTALHYAAQLSNLEVLRLLLRLGAMLEIQLLEGPCAGFTPLDNAREVYKRSPSSVSRLVLQTLEAAFQAAQKRERQAGRSCQMPRRCAWPKSRSGSSQGTAKMMRNELAVLR